MTRLVLSAIILLSLMGCAVNENTYWTVTDSDAYWVRSGYSIKPPSGSDWVKLPTDEKAPNSISFMKGEGVYNRGSTSDTFIYFKGTLALATGTQLKDPIQDRADKDRLAATLQEFLNRYWSTTIKDHSYETLSGADCLKYSGNSKIRRPSLGQSDLNIEQVRGYFCLHPKNNNFGVIMETRNFVTTGSHVSDRDNQIDHFFSSLSFTYPPTVSGAH